MDVILENGAPMFKQFAAVHDVAAVHYAYDVSCGVKLVGVITTLDGSGGIGAAVKSFIT